MTIALRTREYASSRASRCCHGELNAFGRFHPVAPSACPCYALAESLICRGVCRAWQSAIWEDGAREWFKARVFWFSEIIRRRVLKMARRTASNFADEKREYIDLSAVKLRYNAISSFRRFRFISHLQAKPERERAGGFRGPLEKWI